MKPQTRETNVEYLAESNAVTWLGNTHENISGFPFLSFRGFPFLVEIRNSRFSAK
jgi:hypothetical protein